jgi:GT2 family glycosyltransferase
LEKSVLVLASSKVLFQKAMACNKKTIKVKNAADIGHFTHLPESTVLNHVPKPILGYYGAISDWFDMELVGECAKANPGYHFILIGNTFGADLTAVSSFKNVHFLGEIPYQELPKYIRFFDVCLIPFKKNALTEATNPVKFYEYLSSGKPVVTTSIPELFEYKDVCYYSEDREAFIRNIKRALMEKDESLKEKRKRIASENSWDHRIDEIMESVIGLYPKMSIIIVTFNNLEYTKSCLESIFKYSRYPNYELIIVDNYSQDGTRDYLKVVQEKRGNVKIILNEKNKGFPAANNEGLKIAKGEYIVFLNNDTIVTHDWLYDLMRIINIHTRLGMIGPVSNQVGNIQKIPVGYKEMDEMQRWVQQYTRQQTYDYRSINMLGLFCSMVKRKVYEDVGGLDENYGIGCFEDDDYCKRVRKAGYELGYTKKVFIHHAGSVSFKKVRNQEYEKMWNRNKAYFEKKWGVTWSNDLTEFENIAMKEGAGTLQIKEYHQFQLNKIVKNSQRPVIIFYPLIDWNTPVFQRPPQMALSLSKLGYLVFFCTENQKYDKVEGFLEIQDHLYLTNEFDLVRNIEGSDITYVIYSTDNKTLYTDLNEAFKEGKKIIYEYIDEIHEAITGNVPKEIFERHKQILKNDEIIVVATADKLYQEVLRYRSRNCLLVSNGVDYDHFRNKMSKKDVPEEILYMVNKKKPIIGYYGSLASWFDYELVMELAHQRSNYEILLIGYSYDKSLSQYNFSHLSNLAIIGPVDYQFLPQYARWFDVAMIPFRINKITESTSPIKLFEYMAMGHPIVTTDMPECRKYKSVLIGKNRDEFIEKIDEALILKGDKQYSALLEKEAKENTWESRAQAISTLLVNSKK